MIGKYNIVMIPLTQSEVIIKYSQRLSSIAENYLLGANSLPHVTLYQFESDENEIDEIWKKICAALEKKQIDIIFEKVSCTTFDGNKFWVSLLPNNNEELVSMHHVVANAINRPPKTNYDPHMTLINTKNKDHEILVNELSKNYKPIRDTVILSLGKSDEIGQYTEVLLQFFISI